jgi:hypothetical protein
MIPEQRAPINRIPHSPHEAFTMYLRLPKLFTEPHFEDLRTLGERMGKSSYHEHQRAAASAFRESAVAFGRSDFYLETQLDYIDKSDGLLQDALAGMTKALDTDDRVTPADLVRVQAELNLSDLYKDIVCGEVTDLTRDELYTARTATFDTIAQMREQFADNPNYMAHLSGLELERIYELVIALGDGPYEQTLLAPQRGDNGAFLAGDTHDLIHVHFSEDYDILDVYPIEVKTFIDDATRHRYRKNHVSVMSARALHLHGPKSRADLIAKLRDPEPHAEELLALRHEIFGEQSAFAHAS